MTNRVKRKYYADFHIHIGQSQGRPVKITASKNLTLENIFEHALRQKGLDIITIIDAVCPPVQKDMKSLLEQGDLRRVADGGYLYRDQLLVILGAEVEIAGPTGGAAHFGCWFPSLSAAQDFSEWLATVQKNTSLSSQRAFTNTLNLQTQVSTRGGAFIVHHAFTPHKGLYGSCVTRLSDMLDMDQTDALELGLSADTEMADCITELHSMSFLSNSDAHSLAKIAREYNELELNDASFTAVKEALHGDSENRIVANYGLQPELGKYHRKTCNRCKKLLGPANADCSCGGTSYTNGVYDRWIELRDLEESRHPVSRPPYYNQIPLEFIPGLGSKTRQRLVEHFGSEMAVLHRASVTELALVCGQMLADRIELARTGRLAVKVGGAGFYGKILIN